MIPKWGGKTLAFLKVGFAFFIWSLLGPILNLSALNAFQNLFLISIIPCVAIIIYDYQKSKLESFKKLDLNFAVLFFLLLSGLNGLFFFKGLTLMPIAQAFLLLGIGPLITFVIEVVFLKEKILKSSILALSIGFFGVYIVLSRDIGTLSLFNSSYLLGVALILGAAIFYATRAVILKKHSFNWPTHMSIFLILISQTIFSAPFAFTSNWTFKSFEILTVIFLTIFSSFVAFIFYIEAFRKLRPSSINLVGYNQPLLAAIWGYLFLNQAITTNVVLGGILIIAAGYIIVKTKES